MSKRLDFGFDVATKRMNNHSSEVLIGMRASQDIVDGRLTIWDGDGSVQFLSVAAELFITSSSVGDTDQTVTVEGVDADWLPITGTASLNGQTEVSMGTFLHISRATITGGSINAGDLYIAPTTARTGGVPNDLTKILSKIPLGEGTTHNGWGIIPANSFIGITSFDAGVDTTSKVASISVHVHTLTAPVSTAARYNVTPSFSGYYFNPPLVSVGTSGPVLGPKSIIEYRAEVDTNSTEIFILSNCVLMGISELGTTTVGF